GEFRWREPAAAGDGAFAGVGAGGQRGADADGDGRGVRAGVAGAVERSGALDDVRVAGGASRVDRGGGCRDGGHGERDGGEPGAGRRRVGCGDVHDRGACGESGAGGGGVVAVDGGGGRCRVRADGDGRGVRAGVAGAVERRGAGDDVRVADGASGVDHGGRHRGGGSGGGGGAVAGSGRRDVERRELPRDRGGRLVLRRLRACGRGGPRQRLGREDAWGVLAAGRSGREVGDAGWICGQRGVPAGGDAGR